MNETISALLDGECTPSELERLLDEMERDPALREQFSRQCLARDSRMGTKVRSARLDFSAGVIAALQDEQPGTVVVPFAAKARQAPRPIPWKAATGLAAAAAIGAMAVLVLKPEVPVNAPTGVPVATTSPVASPATVVATAASAVPTAMPVAATFGSQDDVTRQQLQNYLRAYSQAREQQHVRSMLGYARYATYTEGQPKARPATTEDPKR